MKESQNRTGLDRDLTRIDRGLHKDSLQFEQGFEVEILTLSVA